VKLQFTTTKEEDKKAIVHIVIEKAESVKKEYFFNDLFRIIYIESCALEIEQKNYSMKI
jgi:hypothetical protein